MTGAKALCVGPAPTANSQRQRILKTSVSKELIEAIRGLSPIHEVIGEHVQLRRSGSHLYGRCPLHADHTPSFSVRPGKGVFRCHGCGAGGDVFKFVQLLRGCTFRASVEFLATRAEVRIDGFKSSPALTAKVSARKSQREEQMQFDRFCNERVEIANRQYRSVARAATNAEDYLRAGSADPYMEDLAWSAVERFRIFEARVERDGLPDYDVFRSEWSKSREAA